ncbi:MAG: hypothetical protein AAF447_02585 [Myxococcota bacterium]
MEDKTGDHASGESLRSIWPRPTPWSLGRTRGFLAGAFDVGFIYARPRFSAGWGRPHDDWVGVDVNPLLTPNSAGAYGGLRARYGVFDLRVGTRYGVANAGSYLSGPRQGEVDEYTTREFAIRDGTVASYLSHEAELTLALPAGPGAFVSETSVTYVSRVPTEDIDDDGDGNADRFGVDRRVYESTLKIIVDPPWVWRTRLGYVFRFGPAGSLALGLVGELVGNPDRELVVFRAGATFRANINARLQLRMAYIPPVIARDNLGRRGGDFGLLSLRYRWATGAGNLNRREFFRPTPVDVRDADAISAPGF